MFLCHFSGY